MKILHLLSNNKLTGPAEPALNLCASLRKMGLDVSFACSTVKSGIQAVRRNAEERGLSPLGGLALSKHFNLVKNLDDVRRLKELIEREQIDLVHAHMQNDHLVGGTSARNANRPVKIVRSSYDSGGFPRSLRSRYMLKRLTDALVVASEQGRETVIEKFGFPEDRIWVVPGAIDLDRFNPDKKWPDMRPRFGLAPTDFVVGIVARIQPQRRFDALLEAMKIVERSDPSVKLLIVGRGSKMNRVAVEPVKQMGLERCVKFAGYHRGDDYVATLACFDAKVFLVPGTDGTCRAVREAMAMGKPVIAARRGMLPEIVDHGVNGLIIDDVPSALAAAMLCFAQDSEKVKRMGDEALKKARQKFGLETQASAVADIYENMARFSARG